MRAEFPLLAAHVLVWGWVLFDGGFGAAYRSEWSRQNLRPEAHRLVVMDPRGHLPLKGMPGFGGDEADACLRMEGFLITVAETLRQLGERPPVEPHRIPGQLERTGCAVDSPELAPLLRQFDRAWRRSGQAPVGPLGGP
jgi:hypothetical protein